MSASATATTTTRCSPLAAADGLPARLVHAFALDGAPAGTRPGGGLASPGPRLLQRAAPGAGAGRPCSRRAALTSGPGHRRAPRDVVGGDLTRPEHATLSGHRPGAAAGARRLTVRHLDVPARPTWTRVVAELGREPARPGAGGDRALALRGGRRWVQEFEPVTVPAGGQPDAGLRGRRRLPDHRRYSAASASRWPRSCARRAQARLVLLARSGAAGPRPEWDYVPGRARQPRTAPAGRSPRSADGGGRRRGAGARRRRDRRRGPAPGAAGRRWTGSAGWTGSCTRPACPAVAWPRSRSGRTPRRCWRRSSPARSRCGPGVRRPPADFVVLCSSVTAVAGGFGQVDYCAANNFLDALRPVRRRLRRPGGVAELGRLAGGRHGRRGRGAGRLPGAPARCGETAIDHPLLTTAHHDADRPGRCGAPAWSRPATHWVLDEHRIRGRAVMPGTAHLERRRRGDGAGRVGRRRLRRAAGRGVPAAAGAWPTARAASCGWLTAAAADGLDFQVTSRTGGERAGARAGQRRAGGPPEPPRCRPRGDPGALPAGLTMTPEQAGSHSGGMLSFGPHWSSLRAVHVGVEEELGRFELAEPFRVEPGLGAAPGAAGRGDLVRQRPGIGQLSADRVRPGAGPWAAAGQPVEPPALPGQRRASCCWPTSR